MENVITSTTQLVELMLGTFLSVIGSVFFYSVVGFILAIVVMIFVGRKKWVKRENGFWNFLTNFHYLFILVAFMVGAPLFGATKSVHGMANDIVSTYLKPTIETQITKIQKVVVELWSEEINTVAVSVKDTTDKLTKTMQYVPDSDEYFGEQKASMINWLVDDLGKWVISATLAAMVNTALDGSVDSVDAANLMFTTQQISNIDYSSSGNKIASSVELSVNRYIDTFFFGYYLNIFILVAFILALPVTEILLYNLWWKKRALSTSRS